jgi:hypothetical protein
MYAFVGIALVVGLVIGALIGRSTAPTVGDRIASVQGDARQTAAALRVLALHDESGALSNQAAGAGGADLVLGRTGSELASEFDRAPWITSEQRQALLNALAALQATKDRTTGEFGTAADALAGQIETTFGTAAG